MHDVVALGELLIDFTPKGLNEQGYPIMHANPGGAPGNFLAAVAKCGYQAAFIGKVGEDAFGTLIKRTLKNAGIDTSGIIGDANVFTTLAFVTLSEDGDREFSFARKPGADMMLTKKDLNREMLETTRVFHFGTISMTDEPARSATEEAVHIAKKAGAWISFDPNYRDTLWKSPKDAIERIWWGIKHTDILKISEEELQMLMDQNLHESARALLCEYGIKLIFVTCGKKGCFFFTKDEEGFVPSFTELKTIDTTGAGDIFGASALSRILQIGKKPAELTYEELIDVCVFANAMAGISTTRNGGIPSIPEPQEALALIQK